MQFLRIHLFMAHRVPLPALRSFAPVQLWLPQLGLARCVRAVLTRHTGSSAASGPELCHYPATPLCTLSWLFEGQCHWREVGGQRSAVTERVIFTGPQRQPNVLCLSGPASGLMLLLYPDALEQMTGLDLASCLDQARPLSKVLPPDWTRWSESVLQAPDDEARVQRIESFLDAQWRAVQTRQPEANTLSLRLKDWSQGLSERASSSPLGRSLRQMERRIKRWTGQPLSALRGLGRAEEAFFQAMEALDMDRLNWSDVAHDSGYADQAHLCREIRRITGLSPQALRHALRTQEGFWIYRAWAQAGGLV